MKAVPFDTEDWRIWKSAEDLPGCPPMVRRESGWWGTCDVNEVMVDFVDEEGFLLDGWVLIDGMNYDEMLNYLNALPENLTVEELVQRGFERVV